MAIKYLAAGQWVAGKFYHDTWATGVDELRDPDGNPIGGTLYFTSLGDTPADYSTASPGDAVIVNPTGDGLIFGAGGGGGGTLDDAYDYGGPGAGRQISIVGGLPVLFTGASSNALKFSDGQSIIFGADDDVSCWWNAVGNYFGISTAETSASPAIQFETGFSLDPGAGSGGISFTTGDHDIGFPTGNILFTTGADNDTQENDGYIKAEGRYVSLVGRGDVSTPGGVMVNSGTSIPYTSLYVGGCGILRLGTFNALGFPSGGYDIGGNIRYNGADIQGYKPGSGWVSLTAGAGGADADWTIVGSNMYANPTGNIGVGGITTPFERLHLPSVGGAIILGSATTTTAGTIQYTGGNYLGRIGAAWHYLNTQGQEIGSGDTLTTKAVYTGVDPDDGSLIFRSLAQGTGISLSLSGDDIVITNIGGGGGSLWTETGGAPTTTYLNSTTSKVAIGTTSANAKLHVTAQSGLNGAYLGGPGSGTGLEISPDWTLGIVVDGVDCQMAGGKWLFDNSNYYIHYDGGNTKLALVGLEGISLSSNNGRIFLNPFATLTGQGSVVLGGATETLALGWASPTNPGNGPNSGSLYISTGDRTLSVNEGTVVTADWEPVLTHLGNIAGADFPLVRTAPNDKSGNTGLVKRLRAGTGITITDGTDYLNITNNSPALAPAYSEVFLAVPDVWANTSYPAPDPISGPWVVGFTGGGLGGTVEGVITCSGITGLFEVNYAITVWIELEESPINAFDVMVYKGGTEYSNPKTRQGDTIWMVPLDLPNGRTNIAGNFLVDMTDGDTLHLRMVEKNPTGGAPYHIEYGNMIAHRVA